MDMVVIPGMIAALTLSCIAGMAHGIRDVLLHDPESFFRTFPGASRQFWDPSISWVNKTHGIKLRRTVFVFVTDAFHLSNFIIHTTLLASGFLMGAQIWFVVTWILVVACVIGLFGSYSLGFTIVYNSIRNNK